MLIVLSDLHLSETQSTHISAYRNNRNLSAETYLAFFREVNQIANANQVTKVDVVLAGDILEISRSSIWLDGKFRPYVDNEEVEPGSELEVTILGIIDAIASDKNVSEALFLFRHIDHHFDMPVNLYLILGNHDRLANGTVRIREKVRNLFGLEGGDSAIDNYLILRDNLNRPFCLVRHGHEYDPTNFALNVQKMDSIPTAIPRSYYEKACLGDITTIEFGAALPDYFLDYYGEKAIIDDWKLSALYNRLLEFDDVRPTSAWLSYLFSMPGIEEEKTWKLIQPAFTKVLATLGDHGEFNKTLKDAEIINPLTQFVLMGILRSGFFSRGIPYWMIKMIMKRVSKSIKLDSQVKWAKREALIQNKKSGCKCVISGHTHFAEVSLISSRKDDMRYYINTGTWRNVIPATKDFKQFGRLKAFTKVMIFYPEEKQALNSDWAFHYMSGMSFGDRRNL